MREIMSMKEVWFHGVMLNNALERNNSFGTLGACHASSLNYTGHVICP